MWSKNGTPVPTATSPPPRSTATRTMVSRVVRSTAPALSSIFDDRLYRIQKGFCLVRGPSRHSKTLFEARSRGVISYQYPLIQERGPHFVGFRDAEQDEVGV